MDASLVRESASWIIAELVRVFHGVSISEAQTVVDALVERIHPLVWEIDGVKRVLAPSMKMGDRVLVLLYSTPGWVTTDQLKAWTRNNPNLGRVLANLFDKQLIEVIKGKAIITPLGVGSVEGRLLTGFS